MAFKVIAGWDVNLDHYGKAKSLSELKKHNELFDNLPKAERTAAFEKLWELIKPPKGHKKYNVVV